MPKGKVILSMSPRPDIPYDETNIYSNNPDAVIFGEKMYYDNAIFSPRRGL